MHGMYVSILLVFHEHKNLPLGPILLLLKSSKVPFRALLRNGPRTNYPSNYFGSPLAGGPGRTAWSDLEGSSLSSKKENFSGSGLANSEMDSWKLFRVAVGKNPERSPPGMSACEGFNTEGGVGSFWEDSKFGMKSGYKIMKLLLPELGR